MVFGKVSKTVLNHIVSFRFVFRLFWLVLIILSFCTTIQFSLQSLHRFNTKSTVVSIERDHYYWNTSVPSLTICPADNRIDKQLFDKYCEKRKIEGQLKKEFYEFIESMANATYETFDRIKNYSSIDVSFLFKPSFHFNFLNFVCRN